MASNYVQPGQNIDLTAPTGGVTSGVGVLIGRLFAVALQTVAAAAAFVGTRVGVWSLAKTSAQAWSVGDKIYWDNTNKRADNVPTAGFRRIGVCVVAAANPSATGKVLLMPGVDVLQGDALPAAASINTAGAVTYTAAQVLGGIIVRDPNGAARNDVLPTAALLVAAIPGAAVGDIIRTKLINGADAAETITLSAGAGGAFDANQTAASQVLAQLNSKDIIIRLTNVTPAAAKRTSFISKARP
jgi:predicted RecA/RadA family phage recombinase